MENSRAAGSSPEPALPGLLDRAARFLGPAEKLSSFLSAAGMVVFMLMVALTFADVFLRYMLGRSMPGTVELTELLMVIVVFSSIAATQWQKSHVTMDILTSRLREPSRALLEAVTGLWSVVIALLCAWTTYGYGAKTSSVTLVLRIPLEPFIYFACFGFCLLALALLAQFFERAAEAARLNGAARALSALALGVAGIVLMWYLATHRIPGMSSVAVGGEAAEMMEALVEGDSWLDGRAVHELGLPRGVLLIGVSRDGETRIPSGGTIIRTGDTIAILCLRARVGDLEKVLAGRKA